LCELLPHYFDVWPHSVEDGRILDLVVGRETQLQLRAAFRAWMLREKKNARLGTLCRKSITVPCGEFHAGDILRCDTAEVEHNGAETTCL
jgi:hypothetical protein